jgi:hypothetical protein
MGDPVLGNLENMKNLHVLVVLLIESIGRSTQQQRREDTGEDTRIGSIEGKDAA